MANNRWVPLLEYTVARVDEKVLVMRRGLQHVAEWVPDDEVVSRPIATAVDYDEAVRIVRALRAEEAKNDDDD